MNKAYFIFRFASFGNRAVFWLLLIAIGLNVYCVLPYFPMAELPDALNTYIPHAQALISDKLAFFLDERSLRVAPMAYIYPALFGADPLSIKIGNTALSCLLVPILYRLGSMLHSRGAGIAAAFLYALSPILAEYKSVVLTEPLFIFLTGLWLMAVAEIVAGRKAFVPLAGVACGLMILTRGTYIYFLYAILAITLSMCWKKEWRQIGQKLFIAHGVAVLFPLLVIMKNWYAFGYPAVATGVGSALYFGSHPLTYGYEAPYLFLGYDMGAVTQGFDHLSIAGDSLLKGVALLMLKQQTLSDILAVYVQKAFAFVFVTKDILSDSVWNQRSLRIMEVVLAIAGLFSIRPVPMRWFIGGALVYQIMVHIPVLYTHRYSVGALEIPLILLSTSGGAHLLTRWSARTYPAIELAAAVAILSVAIAAGEWHRKYSQALMPDILSVPHMEVYQWDKQNLTSIKGFGMAAENVGVYRTTGSLWYFDVPVPELPLSRGEEIYVISVNMAASVDGGSMKNCDKGAVYFRTVDEPGFTETKGRYFQVIADGLPHFYHVSATQGLSPLFPVKEGFLRIAGNCPMNSRIQLNNIVLSLSRVAQTYRKLYLEQVK